MSETLNSLYEQASALTSEERAALAGLLVDSLHDAIDPEIEAEWQKEIARRVADLDSGSVQTIPWADVKARMWAVIDKA